MSVQTQIDRIITAVDAAHAKVAEKGGTTARPYLVANLADAIDTIPEAKDPVLQTKTVTPTTSSQSVTPDSGYDGLSKVTVNAMPTATQATPSITVSSAGKITASATQTAGYVAAGTKSATKQLTTQAAQTITPGTANKTIASGRYLTGTQTIKGDANLVAGNIKSGVSIFGVTGTMTAGEDVTTETNTYTGLLTDLETAINSLPDAGSGSRSTASIIYEPLSTSTSKVILYQDVNGCQSYSGNSTVLECVVPSYIIARSSNGLSTTDSMTPYATLRSSSPYIYVFYISESGRINFTGNTSGGGND